MVFGPRRSFPLRSRRKMLLQAREWLLTTMQPKCLEAVGEALGKLHPLSHDRALFNDSRQEIGRNLSRFERHGITVAVASAPARIVPRRHGRVRVPVPAPKLLV